MSWRSLPLDAPWHANLPERMLTRSTALLENRYINEAGGHSAFPRLHPWRQLDDLGRVFLTVYANELVAVTSNGKLYSIDRRATVTDRTGRRVQVATGRRPTFAKTTEELLVCGGGDIIRFAGGPTTLLSSDAPQATHVVFIQGYVLALDQTFRQIRYTNPGFADQWPALNTFDAEDKPDPMTALIVTEHNEIIVGGPESIELFQTVGDAITPFYRRDNLGEGLFAPYTLIDTSSSGLWGVNGDREFVRITSSGAQLASTSVDLLLEKIDDWTDAWSAQLHVSGQKFLLLSIPRADNLYDGQGLTLLYDYRRQRWTTLSLWDTDRAVPVAWPVWSVAVTSWGVFAGGENGQIYRLSVESGGLPQRDLFRSAHFAAASLFRGSDELYVGNVRVRFAATRQKQADGSATLKVRARLDDWDWLEPVEEVLENQPFAFVEFGSLGTGRAIQVEYETMAGARCDVVSVEIDAEGMG